MERGGGCCWSPRAPVPGPGRGPLGRLGCGGAVPAACRAPGRSCGPVPRGTPGPASTGPGKHWRATSCPAGRRHHPGRGDPAPAAGRAAARHSLTRPSLRTSSTSSWAPRHVSGHLLACSPHGGPGGGTANSCWLASTRPGWPRPGTNHSSLNSSAAGRDSGCQDRVRRTAYAIHSGHRPQRWAGFTR